jgi:hypothetical protein
LSTNEKSIQKLEEDRELAQTSARLIQRSGIASREATDSINFKTLRTDEHHNSIEVIKFSRGTKNSIRSNAEHKSTAQFSRKTGNNWQPANQMGLVVTHNPAMLVSYFFDSAKSIDSIASVA